ncbi:MAG: hypothetical protein AAF196_17540 [Planctomycetota bacterium]
MNPTLVGLTGLLPVLSLGLAFPPEDTERPEVAVRALQIEETRRVKLQDFESHDLDPQTKVLIEFQGVELNDVTHWYGLQIDEATDDQGNDLTIDYFAQDANGDTPETIDRDHMWFFEDDKPTDRLKLDLVLGLAPRSATEIAMLRGSLKMQSATLEAISVTDLREKANSPIESPLLEAASVEGKIGDIDDSSIELEFSGSVGAISEIRLVDGQGEDIAWGTSSSSSDSSKWLSIGFQDLPANARLEIDVATSSEEITVPFRLESLQLP